MVAPRDGPASGRSRARARRSALAGDSERLARRRCRSRRPPSRPARASSAACGLVRPRRLRCPRAAAPRPGRGAPSRATCRRPAGAGGSRSTWVSRRVGRAAAGCRMSRRSERPRVVGLGSGWCRPLPARRCGPVLIRHAAAVCHRHRVMATPGICAGFARARGSYPRAGDGRSTAEQLSARCGIDAWRTRGPDSSTRSRG